MAKAKVKKPKTKTVTLTFPTTMKRFNCRRFVLGEGQTYRHLVTHTAKDGDHVTMCHYQYCHALLCSEHWPEHEEEHLMHQLGG